MKLTTRQIHALEAKHITSPMQLRRWLPIRYIDNSVETGVFQSLAGKHVTVIGTLTDVSQKDMASRSGTYILAKMTDRKTKHVVSVRLFGMYYRFNSFCNMIGKEVIVGGRLTYHPYFGYGIDTVDTFSDNIAEDLAVIPVFSKIKGCGEETLKTIIGSMVKHGEEETIPENVFTKYGMPDINTAISWVMQPQTMDQVKHGMRRLLYDDMFCMAGQFVIEERNSTATGIRISKTDMTEKIIRGLPYTLTEGQQNTYDAIKSRMLAGKHIKALVQGDVGCGKTITAFLAMLLAAENGYQAAIIAPTKILAEQHYSKLADLVAGTGLTTALISGKGPSKETLRQIETGKVQLIVGTHGVLSDKVVFHEIGLLVIDEEHKFGVAQREAILKKQACVDTISMSATPIPRTLASAIYSSNTQIFNISTMPAGRKPVITQEATQKTAFACVRAAVKRKEQVYVVCPAIDIDEDNESGMLSAMEAEKMYKKEFPDIVIAELDGTTKQDKAEQILNDFRNGKIDVLISTTVVEVGVDVKNATCMIIQNAERFGLAGMHQLRGRVGRGSKQSCCLLITNNGCSGNPRINALCSTNDGFKIAEMDMKELRLSGDLFGDQQSGYNKYVQELIRYPQSYQAALKDAEQTESSVLEKHISKTLQMDTMKNNVLKIRR